MGGRVKKNKKILITIVLAFLTLALLSSPFFAQPLLAHFALAEIPAKDPLQLIIPQLSENNFVLSYHPQATILNTTPINFTFNEAVVWNASIEHKGEVSHIIYQTPPVYKEVTKRNTSSHWTKSITLFSSYEDFYENILVEEEIPHAQNISISPQLPFSLTNQSTILITLDHLIGSQTIAISGIHPPKSKERQLIQLPANIGEPVRWVQRYNLTKSAKNTSVLLPKGAFNISLRSGIESIRGEKSEVFPEDKIVIVEQGQDQNISSTLSQYQKKMSSIREERKKKTEEIRSQRQNENQTIVQKVSSFFNNPLSSSDSNNPDSNSQTASDLSAENLSDISPLQLKVPDNLTNYQIEYSTEAPLVSEHNISSLKKRITISSDLHYQNITSYTFIPESDSKRVQLFWVTNGTRIRMNNLILNDTNNNSLIDRVEWITPHLSNQTFEIEIMVLNMQSFPTVGGKWDVEFETSGRANLTIQAISGTSWTNQHPQDTQKPDLQFITLSCNGTVQNYTWINDTLFVEEYYCPAQSKESSVVLTSGKHHLEFDFGGIKAYANNFASDTTYNVSQIYQQTTGEIIPDENTAEPISINLSARTVVDPGFTHEQIAEPIHLTVNETDLYKISYSCVFEDLTINNRQIVTSWVEINNVTEIKPSRTYCYTRENGANEDRCSTGGVFLASLNAGDVLDLNARVQRQQASGTTGTHDDCWLYAQRVKNNVAQIYDSNGGQTFTEAADTTISLDAQTFVNTNTFGADLSNYYINVSKNGWYKIYYHACVDSGPQNNRATPQTYIRKSGEKLTPSDTFSYTRNNGDGEYNCQQGSLLYNLSAGDYIDIRQGKNSTQTTNGQSTLLANTSWLLIERIPHSNVLMVYDNGTQTIANSAAMSFENTYYLGTSYEHAPSSSIIAINQSGLYEVAYSLSWYDNHAGGRRIVCTHLERNSVTVRPSQQCDYTRGTAGNGLSTVGGNLLVNVTGNDTLELVTTRFNSNTNTQENAVWISVVPVRQENTDFPQFSNPEVNDTLLGQNEYARFNVTAFDSTYELAFVNATIATSNYSLTKASGNSDEWSYNWQCTASSKTVNLSYLIAEDNAEPTTINDTPVSGITLECDAIAPQIINASINASSLVPLNTVVKVNASVTDAELNLNQVYVTVFPPAEAAYNISVAQNADEFYNGSVNLTKGGQWIFEFHANDIVGNDATVAQAKDLLQNAYIEVSSSGDTDFPYFGNAQVNDTLLGQNEIARFSIDVFDASSGIDYANATIESTMRNLIAGSGNQWYYDYQCSSSNTGVNFTYAGANDTAGNWNDTLITGVGLECDASAPTISNARINHSSEAPLNSVAKVNATITDTENNIANAYLQIVPPFTAAFNVSLQQSGSEFFNETILLNESGNWTFTFFANDTAQNDAASVIAQDLSGNSYLEVDDPLNPKVMDTAPFAASTYFVSQTVLLQANVTDNFAVNSVQVNITLPNGTISQLTLANGTGNSYNNSFVPLLPGTHNVTFIARDPSGNENASETTTFISFDRSEDVSVMPLTQTSYIIAWADLNRILLEKRHTNGTILVNRIIVDDTATDFSRVDLTPISETQFLLGWIDGASEHATIARYNANLALLNGPTDIETTLNNDRVDISVDVMSDTLSAVSWVDDGESDYDVRLWNHNTWLSAGSEYAVDTALSEDATRQNLISTVALNETRLSHLWFDENGGQSVRIEVTDGTQTISTNNIVINTSNGALTKVGSAALRNMQVAYLWFNDLGDDIYIGVDDWTGDIRTVVQEPYIIDSNPGVSRGVSVAEVTSGIESQFVAAWHDNNAGNIQAAVYNASGGQVTAPFEITDQPHGTYGLLDVASSVSLRSVQLCENTFVIAYTNSSEDLETKGYNTDGSPWNGTCTDLSPPQVTLLAPADATADTSFSPANITFSCQATDGFTLQNISLYITNSQNTSFALNQTNTTSASIIAANWTVPLYNGNYTWNCRAYDSSSNHAWGAQNYSLTVDYANRPPYWSNNQTGIVSGYSASQQSAFNITWQDEFAVSSVFFESNYSGTSQNYTMTNLAGDVYGYSSILPAGSFYWRSHANDSHNAFNETYDWNFSISKASTVLSLASNETFTVLNQTSTNVSCSADNPVVNISLYRDDTLLGTAINNIVSDIQTFNVGSYNYVCNTTGNQNYTSSSSLDTLEVTVKNISICSLSFAPAASLTYGSELNVSCNCTNDQAAFALYRNGTNITSQIGTNITLAAADYAYVCNVTSTGNWTAGSNSTTVSIAKQPSIVNLTINQSDVDFAQDITFDANLSCTLINPSGSETIVLAQGASIINNDTSPVSNVSSFSSIATHLINCSYEGNQNYTSIFDALFVNATDNLAPNVFDLQPAIGSTYQVSETIEIAANVTDNYMVDSVMANITYPNGTTVQLNLTNASVRFNTSFKPLLAGNYSVVFIANDSAANSNQSAHTDFTATDISEDVAIAPLDNTTFAIAWVNTREILLELRQVNGTSLRRTIIDTDGGDFSRIDLIAVNATHVLAAWLDGINEDLEIALFDDNLNMLQGPQAMDTQLGNTGGEDRGDVSVTLLSGSIAGIGWVDDDEGDYDFILWNYVLWSSAGSELGIDTVMAEDATRQNFISNVAINETHISHIWFDENPPWTISAALSDGSSILMSQTTLNTTNGAVSKVGSTQLRDNKVAYAWFEDLNNDIYIGVDRFINQSRTIIREPYIIDSNAGTSQGITVGEINQGSRSLFAVAWHDAASTDIKAAVYDDEGNEYTAPFVVSDDPDNTYRLMDLASANTLRNTGTCQDHFLIAFTNSSDVLAIKAYQSNGSRWNGTCTDTTAADLIITNITFSAYDSEEGQNITAHINVSNQGTDQSQPTTLQINYSLWNSTWLLNDSAQLDLVSLAVNQHTLVNYSFSASPGTYRILSHADNGSTIAEENETNNLFAVNYTTSAWQTFYGSYDDYDLALRGSQNDSFKLWDVNPPLGNIYYSDEDASYNPSDLQPLNGTNDLQQADSVLGMTYFDDSLQSLYDKDANGSPDQQVSIEIAGSIIAQVPVINSTNSTSFFTGLLWDTADGGAEYGGSQDLVFVTRINASQIGAYGQYDYEIRLPFSLKSLTGSIDLVKRIDEVK